MKRVTRLVLCALCLLGLLGLANITPPQALAAPTDDFVITVKTDNPGISFDYQFTIPVTGFGYNYNVDCNNDGTNDTTPRVGSFTCTYGAPGTYTIRIKDNTGAKTGFPRIYFNNSGDKLKLINIVQWGTGKWTSMANAFKGCANMNMTAIDAPDLSAVTDLSEMFNSASSFNANLSSWNTGNVTSMYAMFYNASAFNQPLGSWNTANVTNMSFMFGGASAFNQPLDGWNTATVTNMGGMFFNASAFNQPLGSWNTANVTNMTAMFSRASAFNQPIGTWNIAKVTIMESMFGRASAFNQPLGSWNTANVTSMSEMFSGATSFNQNIGTWNTTKVANMISMFSNAIAFDQNLGSWNVTALNNATGMFSNVALSTANYDALVNAWEAQATHSNVPFAGGSSRYCNSETARSILISTDHWSITDGGKSCADAKMGNKVQALNPTSHRYTLKVSSLGPDTATSLTVTDTLPKHYKNIKVTSATASCQKVKRTITCTLASLPAGSTATIQITASDNGATGKNCASVTTKNDMNLANNSKCVNVP